MKLTEIESKKLQIVFWIRIFGKPTSRVMVSNYSYKCFFSGNSVTKTLIAFPDEIEANGVIAIDKPISEVEMPDIINLFNRSS